MDGNLAISSYDPAGKLIEISSNLADTISSNDGNGLEVKRELNLYDDQTSTWEAQPTKYYIRSSVMKGRVVSEVLSNGKKYRTYIKGVGGETAIQQAYASETAALSEMVLFEFADSSGMSYRTTDKVGVAAATGDGGEGSPIEIDPLGGSIGMFTPYLTLSGGDYEPTYPDVTRVYNRSDDNNYQPDFDFLYATFGSRTADLPGFGTNWGSFAELGERLYSERVQNSRDGFGFITNEEFIAQAYAQAAEQDRAVGEPGEGSDSDSGPATSEESADFAQDAGDSSTLVDTHLAGLYDSSVTVSAGATTMNFDEIDFGFSDKQMAMLGEQIKYMKREGCTKAFTNAGLPSPEEQIKAGITIMSEDFLGNSLNDPQWNPSPGFANSMRAARNANPDTNDVTQTGTWQGHRYIALTGRAFNQVDDWFSVSVVHSFIHSAGIQGSMAQIFVGRYYNDRKEPIMNYKIMKPIVGTGGPVMVTPNHDLEWYGSTYDALIAACTPEGSSKLGPSRARPR